MKQVDVILAARPDHSMQIYQELCRQNFISYLYVTFKFLPSWMRPFIKNARAHFSKGNVSNSWMMTIHNYLSYNKNQRWLIKLPERYLFEHHLRKVFCLHDAKLIHYWPLYCYKEVYLLKKKKPNIISIAEIYMLNSRYILERVTPIMKEFGLDDNLDYIRKEQESFERIMEYEDDFLVPSSLVSESYKVYYPQKRFHVVSFGITVSNGYCKRHLEQGKSHFSFVYCGTISVEKGCDLLCSWFATHPSYEVNLYGSIKYNEGAIFDAYKNCPNIKFNGHVAKEILQNYLIKYDVGIHLSRFDAYSLGVGEIIGCGLPMIVSDQTGNKDDITEFGLGIVTSLDNDSITQSIHRITDITVYNQLCDNIDTYIKTNHKPYSQKIVDLYKDLINR